MKDLKIYLLIAFGLLLVYMVAQYNRPKPVNWNETFSREDRIPFGTYILYDRLHDIFPGAKIKHVRQAPYLTIKDSEIVPGNYIIIARDVKMDEYDFRELEKYMEQGNDVFIAAYYLGDFLEDTLNVKINSEAKPGNKSSTPVRFVNPSLNSSKQYVFDRGIGDQYFHKFDTAKASVLGVNNKNHANFIRYTFGKGSLYILASPYFFTNYTILKPHGAEYAAKALSYLNPKKELIWDEFSSLGKEEALTPMRVFFKYKELRWAYFLALFSLLIFVLYELKRRQRIIPIIEPLENTSVEFVKVVGQVYYQQRDNKNIAQKKIMYFLEHVRSRYNLKTTALDADFAEMLISKSGVNSNLVYDLLNQIAQINKLQKVSDQDMIELNKNIEQFQQQSK